MWTPYLILTIQNVLLIIFLFFSFFNYLYGIASFWSPTIPRVNPSQRKIAVVIAAFNEKYVLEDTLRTAELLSYPNKIIVIADDSTDPHAIDDVRKLARARKCKKNISEQYFQEVVSETGNRKKEPIEIWEAPDFVLFHRPSNLGFKGGSLKKLIPYLEDRGIELMYVLDADWHPQKDALEKTLEVLEASEDLAFVQTKRLAAPRGMNIFQKYVALNEEGCYYVDFEGRQVLGHPILFSGCCTLFRLDAVREVGGFTAGHLTEDLDLTDRFWLRGWKGVYLGTVTNYGEVPFSYDHFRRQQERWAAGSARAFKEYFIQILTSPKISFLGKCSAIRQNAYFFSTFFTGFAVLFGMSIIVWLSVFWDTYSVEMYLYLMEQYRLPYLSAVYFCILSNFVEPLVTIFVKKRRYSEIFHLPMSVWYAWGNLYSYIFGTLKGFSGIWLDWFRTPKYIRGMVGNLSSVPGSIRFVNFITLTLFLCFYFIQGWKFGWIDEFAFLWVPAFLLASLK